MDTIGPNATLSKRRASPDRGQHGLTRLKAAVKALGGRAIDRRTALGRALDQWRNDLITDLGGRDAISTQEEAIITLAVRTKLLLDSIDAWLLTQPSLIDKRRRCLLPVVLQRQQLADALARYMAQLGLKRRAKPVPALGEYVAQRYGNATKGDQGCDQDGPPETA